MQATLDALQERISRENKNRKDNWTPRRDIFLRTSAYLTALSKLGCNTPLHEPTTRTPLDQEKWEADKLHQASLKRGYVDSGYPKCEGTIIFGYSSLGKPFIK